MKMNLIQCYKVIDGQFTITQLTRSQMKKERFYESPIDAIDEILDAHKYNLRDEEFKIKQRKEKIEKLEKCLSDYRSGNDYILSELIYKIY